MPIERDQLKTLAIIVSLGLVFAVVIWLPGHFARQKIQTRITSARHELGIMPDHKAGLSSWYTQVVNLRQTVNGAQKYVPEQDELADVLRGITQAMQDNPVESPELTTRDVTHFANYSVIPVSLQFSAHFPDVFGVLDAIEQMPRLIRIERLDIASNPNDPGQRLSVKLELSTFFSKQKNQASDQEQAP